MDPAGVQVYDKVFLRHWMYDETHYQEGPGPAKRLQREHKAVPADVAVVIAAAMPDLEQQWAAGLGPPPEETPLWPWAEAEWAERVSEARRCLAGK